MTQQNINVNEDSTFKKKLFYDDGKSYQQVSAKLIVEYKPPTPVMKTNVNQTLQSSAGLVQRGTSHYNATLTLLFYSKKSYADWLQFVGSKHKYYDEKGSVYIGIVTGEPDIKTAEMETKYIVTIGLSLIRKQEMEYRYQSEFLDITKHWAKDYIEEMQQMGLIATNATEDGGNVEYFRPNEPTTRAEAITFMMRVYRHIDKMSRGY